MFGSFVQHIRGNSKGCLVFEPLFLIPYSMYGTYATVYMYELGVGATAIGWIASLGLVMQFFSSLLSGYLTDRMGRKAALLTFDLVSWTAATLLWAAAQNVWFFVIAAIVNGFQKIPNTAWYCLLVEDSTPQQRTYVFTALQFIGVIGGMFAPLGGLLVSHFTLIPAVRIMYIIAFVCMTTQFIGRNYATRETEIGLRKRQEAKRIGLAESAREYKAVAQAIVRNPALLLMFGVYILYNFQMTLKTTYLSLYMVNYLQIGDWIVSVFLAVSAVVMLLFMWFVLPRIRERQTTAALIGGLVVSAAANVLLIFVPPGQVAGLAVSTVLSAAGTVVIMPILETAVANIIDDEHRAKMFAILSVLILAFISPSGVIGGWAYQLDPRIPFLLIAAAFAVSAVCMAAYRKTASARIDYPGNSKDNTMEGGAGI
ncbi:MFS transporter [Gordoniibacillus kamchatkensis]|uniref:MFS transporter n=1 Tax=Gordoniibacillus kamchatkensis TaxID=1590651 RepID=UPI000B0201A5|nr:MFS transporter [Paenibacillus sp. VKM B-2647]